MIIVTQADERNDNLDTSWKKSLFSFKKQTKSMKRTKKGIFVKCKKNTFWQVNTTKMLTAVTAMPCEHLWGGKASVGSKGDTLTKGQDVCECIVCEANNHRTKFTQVKYIEDKMARVGAFKSEIKLTRTSNKGNRRGQLGFQKWKIHAGNVSSRRRQKSWERLKSKQSADLHTEKR